MLLELIEPATSFAVLGETSIDWTPKTFYIAAGIVHAILILVGFRLLGVDPENNTFVGALIAAAIGNVAAFFLRDAGLFGILASGTIHFGLLVAITSGEVLKATIVFFLAMATYGGLAMYITPRTPLTLEEIAGIPRVIVSGGLEAEPITEEEANELAEPVGEKK